MREAELFAALADPTRLWLVRRLCDAGPLSISRLTEGSVVTRQAVTKHLLVMEVGGLVRSSRRGREVRWELDKARLKHARNYLEQISRQWDDALKRARSMVEAH